MNKERAEALYLAEVLQKVDVMLNHLGSIPRHFSDDDSEPQTADEVAQKTVERLRDEQLDALKHSKSEPYFGRLDLVEQGGSDLLSLYIGKRGIEDTATGNRLVIDWRAPIASVFYSFSGQGLASYEAPDGTIEADVHLKRNLAVRGGQLVRLVDSYVKGQDNLNVTDEFLLYRLSEHKESRLRDIVSTIQAEQDKIIRAPHGLAIVIQGVAGSGKTTVALHRLAYLLYQYSERMRTHRMVIFAPNAMFVDYISEVLPELGVGGIRQTTFASWALQVLDHKVTLANPLERYERWFAVQTGLEYADEFDVTRYKGSVQFLAQVDMSLEALEQALVPASDFEPWEGARLTQVEISKWFYDEYHHYPVGVRRDRVLARVKRWMETAYRDVKEDDKAGAKKKLGNSRYRSYMKRWMVVDPVTIYSDLLPARMKRLKGPRPLVHLEDLAPLLYIHARLNGLAGDEQFDHVVIDEAQDFSPFQIAVLQAYCPTGSFTILGDLSQSIHGYQGIANWQEFLSRFEEGRRAFFQLDVSYRSTTEIIEFANDVIRRFEQFTLAKPVFRSGEPVVVTPVNETQRLSRAVATVEQILAAGANTVAVVCRTEAECEPAFEAFLAAGLTPHLITSRQQSYQGGISVVPVYLTKGLEFDGVLLLDVDAANYDESPLSAKLLYVGCTRALHHLHVHYTGERSPLIEQPVFVTGE